MLIYSALTFPAFAQSTVPEAGDTTAQQAAYRNSVAEQTLRKQTEKLQAQISQLAAELKLNGMDNADITLLTKASDHLGALSQEDMQKVITALQSASLNGQKDPQQNLVTAFKGQNEISLSLKSLAADLAAQESQREIPSKLETLIAKQSANIRQTSALAAGNQSLDQLSAPQKSTHDVICSEQNSIEGEIAVLAKILSAAPAAPTADDNSAATSKAVLDAINASPLKDLAASATQLTVAGPFPDAVTKQKAVRDSLTSLLRTSLSTMDPVARLEHVRTQLDHLLGDQQDLAGVTQQAKLEGSVLAERQAKISDRTSVTEALLQPLSPPALTQVGQAQEAMAQSSDALAKTQNASTTVPLEHVVIDDLKKAETLLDQQIASAEKQENSSPADKLAQLEQLQSEIQQAQKNPQVTAADLQKTQQSALTPSPQAANKIADAADKLQQPQPDTNAANQLLAQANDIVQQQINALQQSAQAYQALSQASQQLSQAQQQAAAANQSMQNNTNNLTDAARDLAQAQANVDQVNQTSQQSGMPTDAQQALQQASAALKNATMQAVQAQAAGAQAQDQKAMAAMQQAQNGLGQAMAQVQQQSQGQGKGQGQGQGPGKGPGQGMAQNGQAGASEAPKGESGVLKGVGAGGIAQVVGGLTSKDRDAITQFQAEKSPPEYAPLVQQYLKNLADSDKAQ
jgi:hypothetical protein